jgi:hypothetical protein
MHASPLRTARVALLLTTLPSAACWTAAPARGAPDYANDQVITASEIAQSGAMDAWDVLRRLGPPLTFRERAGGEPLRLESMRGPSSILNRATDTPLVVIDGMRFDDVNVLRQVRASSIMSISLLNPVEGERYQRVGAGARRVILVTTKQARVWR